MLQPWLVREREQPSYRHTCARGAVQRYLSALNRVREATIAKPNPGESPEIGSDRDVDFSASRRLEANLDVIGTQQKPPIPWTAVALWDAAKIETNDETLRRYLGRTDLPSHPPTAAFSDRGRRDRSDLVPSSDPTRSSSQRSAENPRQLVSIGRDDPGPWVSPRCARHRPAPAV
jgi:hypothetical protein